MRRSPIACPHHTPISRHSLAPHVPANQDFRVFAVRMPELIRLVKETILKSIPPGTGFGRGTYLKEYRVNILEQWFGMPHCIKFSACSTCTLSALGCRAIALLTTRICFNPRLGMRRPSRCSRRPAHTYIYDATSNDCVLIAVYFLYCLSTLLTSIPQHVDVGCRKSFLCVRVFSIANRAVPVHFVTYKRNRNMSPLKVSVHLVSGSPVNARLLSKYRTSSRYFYHSERCSRAF